jgi:hypothetical protein
MSGEKHINPLHQASMADRHHHMFPTFSLAKQTNLIDNIITPAYTHCTKTNKMLLLRITTCRLSGDRWRTSINVIVAKHYLHTKHRCYQLVQSTLGQNPFIHLKWSGVEIEKI